MDSYVQNYGTTLLQNLRSKALHFENTIMHIPSFKAKVAGIYTFCSLNTDFWVQAADSGIQTQRFAKGWVENVSDRALWKTSFCCLIRGTGALVLQKLMDASVHVRRPLQDYWRAST